MDKQSNPKHRELFALLIVLIIIVLVSDILSSYAQKNDSLELSASSEDDMTVTWLDFVIPVSSALGSAGLTAYLTYKVSHFIENRREKKAEDDERKFNRRLAQSIHMEIKACLDFLEGSLNPISKEVPYGSKPSDRLQVDISQLKGILFKMAALPRSYTELPTERKIKSFSPDILDALEWGYRCFNQLLADLRYKYEEKERVGNNLEFSRIDLDECLKNLRLAMDKIANMT